MFENGDGILATCWCGPSARHRALHVPRLFNAHVSIIPVLVICSIASEIIPKDIDYFN